MAPDEIFDTIHRPKHYVGKAEPLDLIVGRDLNFCEGSIIKYVCRWRKKGGLEDLKKAEVYIQRLIKEEEEKKEEPRSRVTRFYEEAHEATEKEIAEFKGPGGTI